MGETERGYTRRRGEDDFEEKERREERRGPRRDGEMGHMMISEEGCGS